MSKIYITVICLRPAPRIVRIGHNGYGIYVSNILAKQFPDVIPYITFIMQPLAQVFAARLYSKHDGVGCICVRPGTPHRLVIRPYIVEGKRLPEKQIV